jgi:Tol biopolymer transport system component
VSAGGGKAVQITPKGVIRTMPQESPDGKYLYFKKRDKTDPPYPSLWRMPVGGGEEAKVLDSIGGYGGYRVREQGIYFFAPPDAQGRSDICLYEFATGKAKKILTIERAIDFYIDAAPDGRAILYTQKDQAGSDLMLVENFR